MTESEFHEWLIQLGLGLHELGDYKEALCVFERALVDTPDCAAIRYNVANTMHMLGRHREAVAILIDLINTSDDVYVRGCPVQQEPSAFKLDALYLLFLAKLHETGDWSLSFPYAEQYLEQWSADVDSAFSLNRVSNEIESLRLRYRP